MPLSYTTLRRHGDAQLEAQRHNAQQAARPAFAGMTPAQQATEWAARLEIARQHNDREGFEAAKAGLAALIEKL